MAKEKSTTTTRDENVLDEQLRTICNLEGITLIWYDPKMNVSMREGLKVTKKYLRRITNFVLFEKEEESCINTIKSIKNEKILFVTSGSGADRILSFDNKSIYKRVHIVFIFCHEKDKYQDLLRKYSKINGIFTDSEELKMAIKIEVDLIERHFETFMIYDENEQKSICDLSQQNAPFFWLSLFKEVVVQMPKDKKAKSEMIDTCTKYYHGNQCELKNIQDFNQGYKPEHAIRWYTKSSFVYKLVNKALRIGDVEQLYIFRFYINDLCEEIEKRHKQIPYQPSWLFYRGARLPLEEVENLKKIEGNLISTNGFLSTSLSKEVAVEFASMKTIKDTEESVLFEIECDNESATFALIEKDSVHPEEKEVLFGLGTTFEVLSVTNNQEEEGAKINMWTVKLKSTQEGKKMAQEFVKSYMGTFELLGQLSIELCWGMLLSSMGEPDKSFKYFQKLLNARPTNVPVEKIHVSMIAPLLNLGRSDEALEHLKVSQLKQPKNYHSYYFYGSLGAIYKHKGQYNLAVEEYKKALQMSTIYFGEHHSSAAENYFQIGEAYLSAGQYQFALDNLSKAEEICEKYYPDLERLFRKIYNCFAYVYRRKREHSRALEYYQKTIDMYEKFSSQNCDVFDSRGETFHHMGLIQGNLNQINFSLQCLSDSLERKQKYWHDIDPDSRVKKLFITGIIYMEKGQFETSLKFLQNALNQFMQRYGPVHDHIACMYYNKGTVLEFLGRNDEALIAFAAALDMQKKLFSDGHRNLAFSLSSVGNQYRIKKDFTLAKEYCNEALAMQQRILPHDDADIFLPLYHIGLILYDQQNYEESLSKLWKALKTGKGYVDSMSYTYQGLILTIIGDINKRLEKVRLALQCFKDALSSYEIFFSDEHPLVLELRSKIKAIEENSKVS